MNDDGYNDYVLVGFLAKYPRMNGREISAAINRVAKTLIDTVDFNDKPISWHTQPTHGNVDFIKKIMGWDNPWPGRQP